MRITAQNTLAPRGARYVSLTWTSDEDPSGYLARLVESGDLATVLAAVADPMKFAGTGLLTDRADAEQRVRASVALMAQLADRIAVLTVALRDTYGASWRELAALLEPDAELPQTATALGAYKVGRTRTGLPGDSSDLPEA